MSTTEGSDGGGELRLGVTTAERIAAFHEDAASAITTTARSMPTAIDGGLGSDLLARIVAGVATTADDIALVNEASALLVLDIDGAFGTTETDVAEGFASLEGGLS